jgi:hypothetical protein
MLRLQLIAWQVDVGQWSIDLADPKTNDLIYASPVCDSLAAAAIDIAAFFASMDEARQAFADGQEVRCDWLSNVSTCPETLLTSVNYSQPTARGKNEKFSSTTSGIDRYCGDKFAPVNIAAHKLR